MKRDKQERFGKNYIEEEQQKEKEKTPFDLVEKFVKISFKYVLNKFRLLIHLICFLEWQKLHYQRFFFIYVFDF